jgi:NTE family protein
MFSRWVGDYRLSMTDLRQRLLAGNNPASAQFRKWVSAEPLPSIFEVLLASINIMETRLTQTRLSLDRPDVIIQPPLGHIRFMEFGRADEIIAIGYEHTQRQLAGRTSTSETTPLRRHQFCHAYSPLRAWPGTPTSV